MKQNLTAIILTYNEAQHIERCIKSLLPVACNIIVIDSFSKDKTVTIAEKLGAKVFQNTWLNYASQFQWGLNNASITTDWVMRIDADEYLEENSLSNLGALSSMGENISGVYIKRKYFFMGKWMKYGAMYPIKHLRIWRHGHGRIENRWMDEHIVLEQGNTSYLDVNIVDDNLNDISWWIEKHNTYATREMLDLLNEKYHFLQRDDAIKNIKSNNQARIKRLLKENMYAKLPLFVRPVLYFLYRYFLRFGFLDGRKGFAFHFMQGLWYRSLVDLKILESKKWLDGKNTNQKDEIIEIISLKTGYKLSA